jgi:two-component system, NtrC family, response regulator AtoC
VRFIAATHRDLEQMAEQQQFRQDLWFRLSAMELRVAPLHERPEEIAPLVHHFLRLARSRFASTIEGFEPSAMRCLSAYRWPGNVRELRNVIERAVLLAQGPLVTQDDLPDRVRRAAPSEPTPSLAIETNSNYHDMVRDYEIRLIEEGLRIAEGNQTRAAQLLKIPLRTFSYKLRQYAIKSK